MGSNPARHLRPDPPISCDLFYATRPKEGKTMMTLSTSRYTPDDDLAVKVVAHTAGVRIEFSRGALAGDDEPFSVVFIRGDFSDGAADNERFADRVMGALRDATRCTL